jgi:hypothetical protein
VRIERDVSTPIAARVALDLVHFPFPPSCAWPRRKAAPRSAPSPENTASTAEASSVRHFWCGARERRSLRKRPVDDATQPDDKRLRQHWTRTRPSPRLRGSSPGGKHHA